MRCRIKDSSRNGRSVQLYSQTDTHGHETWLVKLEIGNDAAYLVYDTLEHADESYEEIDEHLVWSLK